MFKMLNKIEKTVIGNTINGVKRMYKALSAIIRLLQDLLSV